MLKRYLCIFCALYPHVSSDIGTQSVNYRVIETKKVPYKSTAAYIMGLMGRTCMTDLPYS